MTGSELGGEEEAKLAATTMTGEVLCDEGRTFLADGRWHVEVTDEWGVPLFRLKVELEPLGRRAPKD